MKAKEAAEIVNKNPNMLIKSIFEMIPDYPNPLHRNQWIANFLKSLEDEPKKRVEAELKRIKEALKK